GSRQHSADAALLERDGRRITKGFGGELEEPRTTPSPGNGALMTADFPARLSRICPSEGESVAPQVGLEPTTLRLTGGKRNLSRPLRPCAGRWWIALHRS